MNQCTVCGQKGDQPHMCGGTPTLPGSETARYASCHHFAVVMSDECPWCLKTKLEETLLQLSETRSALGEILEVTKREVNAGTNKIQMIAKKIFGDTVIEKPKKEIGTLPQWDEEERREERESKKRKCALCESEAVGKIGAEPRCERHV